MITGDEIELTDVVTYLFVYGVGRISHWLSVTFVDEDGRKFERDVEQCEPDPSGCAAVRGESGGDQSDAGQFRGLIRPSIPSRREHEWTGRISHSFSPSVKLAPSSNPSRIQ